MVWKGDCAKKVPEGEESEERVVEWGRPRQPNLRDVCFLQDEGEPGLLLGLECHKDLFSCSAWVSWQDRETGCLAQLGAVSQLRHPHLTLQGRQRSICEEPQGPG